MHTHRLPILIVLLAAAACGPRFDHEEMTAGTSAVLQQGTRALAEHRFDRALTLADSALGLQAELAGAHFLRGRVHAEMGRYGKADSAYRKVLELDPSYRGAWHNLANNAYRRHEFRAAIRYYGKELERHPAAAPWQSMGRAYRELGLVDSAMYAYERSLREDSTHVRTYVDLAQLLDDEGDYGRAVRYAEEGYRRDPENLELRYMLGSILVRAERPNQAVDYLRGVAEEWPWHHSTYYNLGRALIQTGREAEGTEFLRHAEELRRLDARIGQAEKAVQSRPSDPGRYVELATLMRQAGRYEEAMHAYRVALRLEPGNPNLLNNISGLHMLLGEPEEAVRLLRRVLEIRPQYIDGWLNLGTTYAQIDSTASARRAWRNVLRIDPDNEIASDYLDRLDSP